MDTRQSKIAALVERRETALAEFRQLLRSKRGGMHQREFAKMLGVHWRSVSDWELGNKIPRLDMLHRLAYKLDDYTLTDVHKHAEYTTHNTVEILDDLVASGMCYSDIARAIGARPGSMTDWTLGGAIRQDYYQLLLVLHGERCGDNNVTPSPVVSY